MRAARGHPAVAAAKASGESLVEVVGKPPTRCPATGLSPSGQPGYWECDVDRVRDEIGDAIAKQQRVKGPANSFAQMLDVSAKVHHTTAAHVVPPADVAMPVLIARGRSTSKTGKWSGATHVLRTDVVGYRFVSAAAWAGFVGTGLASATETTHGFAAVVAPHGRLTVSFGPTHPGYKRLLAQAAHLCWVATSPSQPRPARRLRRAWSPRRASRPPTLGGSWT